MTNPSKEQIATKEVEEIEGLSAEEIDAMVEFVLKTQEVIKALEIEVEAAKNKLRTNFILPAKEREALMGNQYYAEKIPVDLSKNDLDYTKAALLLTPEELTLVMDKVINVLKLKAMIKAKAIDACLIPMIKTENWTSKMLLKHRNDVQTIVIKSDEKVKVSKKTKESKIKIN